MFSWYPPNVLMISPDVLKITECTHGIPPRWCTHGTLRCTEHPPNVLMISPSPMHSWYPLMYLTPPMYSRSPPMYWTPPDVMNTPDVLNIPRCTEHTLYRVILCSYQVHKWKYYTFFLFNCEFMHFWCHTIHCSPVCGKPKKTYLVFCVFPQKTWLFYMEWPSKHSCNYKVTMIIYFLALYS